MTEAIRLEDVRFGWESGTVPLLDIATFSVAQGERLFLHGPSGSGKSTLINLLAGVLLPASGTVELLGSRLSAQRSRARDRFRGDHIGMVFQQFNLLPWLTVHENVTLPCHFSRLRRARAGDLKQAVDGLLDALDLGGLGSRQVGTLSVGQQQRVALARALIGTPEIIIADEPTSALDSDRREGFLSLLFGLADSAGSTVVFVSHERALASRFDRSVALATINRAADAAVGERAS